jgi:hypothetical protein
MENYPAVQALSAYLNSFPANTVKFPNQSKLKILELLKDCWPWLKGSGEAKTFANKLFRAENLRWKRPILTFQLERHGGTVNGSSRAELHYWHVDLEQSTATINKTGRRQLEKMAPRMDTQLKAQEVAANILNERDHPSLSWENNREYVVIAIGEIITETEVVPQTTQGRRRRFRGDLEEIMLEQGWIRKDKGNKMGFLRPSH